jgi:hypothetical protein
MGMRVSIHSAAGFSLGLLGFLVGGASCARVPGETVQLSTALGSDLAETHRAHRALIDDYFGLIRRSMITFVETKYRPFIIRYLLTEEKFDKEFADATEKSKTGSSALIDLAEIFTEELSTNVAEYQTGLIAPVDSMQRELLSRVDARYALMSSASAELTGYLGSLAKLQAAREATLKQLGLGGFEQDLGSAAAALSDKVARLNTRAEKIEDDVRDGKQKVGDALNALKALRDTVASPAPQPK